ncbi:HNH endonuclease domain-containing protein [Verrucomicrobium sp. 3C]|uniref:HNH endonuclease domain-containing protein n=1 Tax=Verrucomicrobium sp. 3C TaxID=1134055 RepID=UPI000364BF63|nr:HNH endonuclease domain-containing protein [Verrucomicrobium sp. 3C]
MRHALLAFLLLIALGYSALAQSPILPDPKLTPGDTFPVSREDVCVPGYSKTVRDVPIALKREVLRRYGVPLADRRNYEIDHLIPLSLGGSNSIRNLWPQSRRTQPWNAGKKDFLEDRLHKLVCSGRVDFAEAQKAIASNWIEAYRKYIGSDGGTQKERGRAAGPSPAQQAQSSLVWVNTRSRAYWKPGSSLYGKTKKGQYMTEEEAKAKGFHPAHGTGN